MPSDARPLLLPVADALSRILDGLAMMPAEDVSLTDALGRVTAEPIISRRTQPPVAVSSMDGYAVRAGDVAEAPVTLTRIGSAPAGTAFAGTVGPGQTVRIFTGGPVPDGADAIVIQENVDAPSEDDGVEITVRSPGKPGQNIRGAGLDFSEGDVGIPAGHVMTARDIGFAAAMDLPWIRVRQRPRIAILATGDEIVRPGDPIGENQIVSSNSFALAATVTICGGEPLNLGIAPDDIDGLRAMAQGAKGADMLVTTGGASVGEHDLIQSALGKDGLEVDFWRIAMRPGKPLIFGRIGDTPMLGLPGNPVSTLVCATLFLRPAMFAMLGLADADRPNPRARLAVDLGENDERQDYLRARLTNDADGNLIAQPFGKQDSSMLSSLARSDCLIVRASHDPARRAGDEVEVLMLGDSLFRG